MKKWVIMVMENNTLETMTRGKQYVEKNNNMETEKGLNSVIKVTKKDCKNESRLIQRIIRIRKIFLKFLLLQIILCINLDSFLKSFFVILIFQETNTGACLMKADKN